MVHWQTRCSLFNPPILRHLALLVDLLHTFVAFALVTRLPRVVLAPHSMRCIRLLTMFVMRKGAGYFRAKGTRRFGEG